MAEKKADKAKKLTLPQFRKAVRNLSEEETAGLLEGLYKSCPEASDYMNLRLAGEEFRKAYLNEMKTKLHSCFYNRKGKASLDLDKARDLVGYFGRVSAGLEDLAELKLAYIELGTDIIRHYRRIPDELYIGLERMADSLAETLNAAVWEDESGTVEGRFREQLEALSADFLLSGNYIYSYFARAFGTIRWRGKEEAALSEKALATAGDGPDGKEDVGRPGSGEVQVISDSSNVLPEEDVKLFYRIFFGLLDYVNEKKKVNDLKNLADQKSLEPQAVKQIASAVWQDTSLIDDYLAGPGSSLPPAEQAILESWKRRVSGRFIVERNLKKGSVVISLEDNSVYLVRGIKTSLEEMFFYRPLPVMIEADLLPFKGVVITDGLVSSMNIFMGGGMKKQFKDFYNRAKKLGQIHTSL